MQRMDWDRNWPEIWKLPVCIEAGVINPFSKSDHWFTNADPVPTSILNLICLCYHCSFPLTLPNCSPLTPWNPICLGACAYSSLAFRKIKRWLLLLGDRSIVPLTLSIRTSSSSFSSPSHSCRCSLMERNSKYKHIVVLMNYSCFLSSKSSIKRIMWTMCF